MLIPCKVWRGRPTWRLAAAVLMFSVILVLTDSARGCGPGRGSGRRRIPRKLTPLVFKQHVPNVSENTLGASGLTEGKMTRDSPKFKELAPNYNSDIIFKDEEGTGADRLMTQRCKEKLNTLAISVMNQWPGIRLRVTEGWDEEGLHASDSLHYEGRAVDITTSDRDRSKYGMLARLAVEAGFDWVYYESRSHIHCSVKSESADPSRSGGCFHKDSVVRTPKGTKKMSQLLPGDEVLVVASDGTLQFSPVVFFLDRDESQTRAYQTIITERGTRITLTPSHLIFLVPEESPSDHKIQESTAIFARDVLPGYSVFVIDSSGHIRPEKVVNITSSREVGVFAPLTREGNLVVNSVVASCYAVVNHQTLAHWAFAPVRVLDNLKQAALRFLSYFQVVQSRTMRVASTPQGIHWYPKLLYSLSHNVLPQQYLYH